MTKAPWNLRLAAQLTRMARRLREYSDDTHLEGEPGYLPIRIAVVESANSLSVNITELAVFADAHENAEILDDVGGDE